ncbi:hypothetical protein Pmani_014139 [Petrolisthes manimaculis]|uniref:Uncharacterized protein n=1 Tax=Petrolisthes manimaculis TaxID=1843537 RepID=A0AAE1PWX5_9EUCA|nr:hypothetical protein Pmani_014139 [Petrolisthes manimaculis]
MKYHAKAVITSLKHKSNMDLHRVKDNHWKSQILESYQRLNNRMATYPEAYKRYLELLTTQMLCQLLEEYLLVYCRREDTGIMKEVLPSAVATYKHLTGRKCKLEIATRQHLPSDTRGVLLTRPDKNLYIKSTIKKRLYLLVY